MAANLSIIIPARNSERTLGRTLAAVAALRRPVECETIVVDNGSTDGTAALVRSHPEVRLVHEPKRGAACARNAGLRASTAPFVAFTDSDCEPDPAWLEDLFPVLAGDPTLAAVGGTIRPGAMDSIAAQYIDWRHIFEAEQMFWDVRYSPPFLMTANAICRRAAIDSVGGFDERLWPSEDADLCWRLAFAGWKLAQFPDRGAVVHNHRSTLRGLARMGYYYGLGGADLFAKHRAAFGESVWVDGVLYWKLLKGVLKTPVCPFLFRDPMHRWRGVLDVLYFGGFAAGRLRAAIRNRVLTL